MLACYVAVVASLVVGLAGGARIGLRAGAAELADMLRSGELMRRVDIGVDRSLP